MGTPWKFNIDKTNWCLGKHFPFGMPSFEALYLVSGRGGVELVLLFLYSKDLVALFRVFCIISAHTHTQSATIEPFLRKRKNQHKKWTHCNSHCGSGFGFLNEHLNRIEKSLNSAGDLGKGWFKRPCNYIGDKKVRNWITWLHSICKHPIFQNPLLFNFGGSSVYIALNRGGVLVWKGYWSNGLFLHEVTEGFRYLNWRYSTW